jgi:pimeloyl-ACP methyl ester carboxylesterase
MISTTSIRSLRYINWCTTLRPTSLIEKQRYYLHSCSSNGSSTGVRTLSSQSSSGGGGGGRVLHHEWIIDGKVITKSSPPPSLEDQRRTVIFLHGLLGNGKNLRSPAKRLTQQYPNLKALMLDLRGHGQSTTKATTKATTINNNNNDSINNNQQHTIHNCALDIIETTKTLQLTGHTHSPIGVIGHSFGGRCALEYVHTLKQLSSSKNNTTATTTSSTTTTTTTTTNNILPPKCTWLLDTVPGKAHSSVSNVIQGSTDIDISTITSKQELVKVLTVEHNIDKAIAAWMTTNLKKSSIDKTKFEFMFDLETVIGVLDDFPKQNFMKMIDDCTSTSASTSTSTSITTGTSGSSEDKVYLVMAGKNNAWTDDIVSDFHSRIQRSQQLELVSLPKAGHWVHVDDLDGLMYAMDECFDNLSS